MLDTEIIVIETYATARPPAPPKAEAQIILPRDFLMGRRRAILTELDELEKLLGIAPRTSELRKKDKEGLTEHKF